MLLAKGNWQRRAISSTAGAGNSGTAGSSESPSGAPAAAAAPADHDTAVLLSNRSNAYARLGSFAAALADAALAALLLVSLEGQAGSLVGALVDGRIPEPAELVRVGAALQQQPDDRRVAPAGGIEEGRLAADRRRFG